MSNYSLIPILGKIARLKEISNSYDLNPDEKRWVQVYLTKLEKDRENLEKYLKREQ